MSKIDEKEIKRRFEAISQFELSPEVTARDLERVGKMLAGQTSGQRTMEQKMWRMIMKSPITKLAAAAVIIIVATIGLNHFVGPIYGTNAVFAKMAEAIDTYSSDRNSSG
ncbi:MAG: hypothetical protein ACYSWZ_06100 [Planctomycetota bacterium]|jgi:hypothetical protein